MRVSLVLLLASFGLGADCADSTEAVDAGCQVDCLANGFCYEDGECDVDAVCFDVACTRAPSCKDEDATTVCPTNCVGTCENPVLAGFCSSDAECARFGDGVTCRTDDRFA